MSLIPPSFQGLALPGLRDAVVLITGATRGSGLMMAHLFAHCGAHVAINSRSHTETTQLAEVLHTRYHVPTLAVPGDVSNAATVAQMFETIAVWSAQRLEVLICNAGHPLVHELWHTPLHEMKEEEVAQWFEQVRAVDLEGARFCCRHALRLMLPQRRGSIVLISSTPALSGYRGTPYTEAKAALLGLMHDLAREYGAHNIRVNAVALGNIASGWYESLSTEQRNQLAHEAPLARWGQPEEVAGAILFLASELSGFVTGQTLVVDGGKVMR
ncbi:MAG: SDR family NAD(P)-dependent oxidoreductase [candidate division KSB1 bacterium]